jgi:hypothetical protein
MDNSERIQSLLKQYRYERMKQEQCYWDGKNENRYDMKEHYYEKEREHADTAKYLKDLLLELGVDVDKET